MARTFGFFRAPPSEALTELGRQKGHMRRKAQNRLWTLILSMLLCGAVLAPAARIARAGDAPTDPVPGAPPGDPQAGDPDAPTNGRGMPKPGSNRGASGQAAAVTQQRPSISIWMLRLRIAFAAVYRILFRI